MECFWFAALVIIEAGRDGHESIEMMASTAANGADLATGMGEGRARRLGAALFQYLVRYELGHLHWRHLDGARQARASRDCLGHGVNVAVPAVKDHVDVCCQCHAPEGFPPVAWRILSSVVTVSPTACWLALWTMP